MKRNPVFSVIIPVYNGALFLRQAIDSIFKQSFDNFEIILIDDGSTDKSLQIAHSFQIDRIIEQDNRGVTEARNRGIEFSRGEIITFIDQDDFWNKNTLALHYDAHHQNDSIEFAYGQQICFLDDQSETVPNWFKYQKIGRPYLTPIPGTTSIKKSCFILNGLFDEEITISSDFAWFRKMRKKNVPFKEIDQILLNRRIHQNNLSGMSLQIQNELFKILRTSE